MFAYKIRGSLDKEKVDIWLEKLLYNELEYEYYLKLLDTQELSQSSRLLQAEEQHRYVISHAKLRLILSKYTGIAAESINYSVAPYGKPFILFNGTKHKLNFNMSHSKDIMLVAIGWPEFIGIDAEIWNKNVDVTSLAKNYFSEIEYQYWIGLPDKEKLSAFYTFWTRKESFIKAIGHGMLINVAKVESSTEKTSKYLSIPKEYGLPENWRLIDLPIGHNMSVALTANTGN